MNYMNHISVLILAGALAAVAGCSADDRTAVAFAGGASAVQLAGTVPVTASTPADDAAPSPVAGAAPLLVVHKHPSCGCCGAWIEHMRAAGFAVQVHDHQDMGPVKQRVGVPYAKGSCHTAEIDGYFLEGHVPAADVERLLAERPQARGLTVPGMPAGSPGMEMPDGTVHPYAVELVHLDGSTSEYARHGD